jgi:uncharacterized metal-binding protein
MNNPILILPCSGIGKVLGSISRDATFLVVDEMRPGKCETNCLSLLVMGDDDAIEQVKTSVCIAVDGCTQECAKKNIELAGGDVNAHFYAMDVVREHRDLKTNRVTVLDENGRKLSQILAEKIAEKVDELDQLSGEKS